MHTLTIFILVTLSVIALAAILWTIVQYYLAKRKKKKGLKENKKACSKVNREIWIRNHTSYFWSDSSRFAWISIFMIFFIALGIVSEHTVGYLFSIIIGFLFLFFLWFARMSYSQFQDKAKAQLNEFENTIKNAISKEISFEGDNFQRFSNQDYISETGEKIFEFPVNITKVPFPPFEDNVTKQPIILSRKLEFLILSREYFSICKGATTFNLLDPARAGVAKKCAETKAPGECHEYYYSQMRNVVYKDNSIQIIFDNEDDNVAFKCPKAAANRKPAMKALKEKLRITERQRLKKIDEQKKFEDLYDKRLGNGFTNYKKIEDNEIKESLKKEEKKKKE